LDFQTRAAQLTKGFTYKDVKNLQGAFVGTDAKVVICNWGVIGIIFWKRKKNTCSSLG